MKQKIFVVSQISNPRTESRKYADGIYACINYGLRGLKGFVNHSAHIYSEVNQEYELSREKISKKILTWIIHIFLKDMI